MRRLMLFLAGVAMVMGFKLNELIPESQTKKAMDAWK